MKPFKDRRGEYLEREYLWAVAEAKKAMPDAEVLLATCDYQRALEMAVKINTNIQDEEALIFVTYLVEPSTKDKPPTPKSKEQIREFIKAVAEMVQ